MKGITFLGPKEGEEGKERGCISKREFNADDGSRRPNGNFKGHPGFKVNQSNCSHKCKELPAVFGC